MIPRTVLDEKLLSLSKSKGDIMAENRTVEKLAATTKDRADKTVPLFKVTTQNTETYERQLSIDEIDQKIERLQAEIDDLNGLKSELNAIK